METRKLYYEDCQLWQFTARVTGCHQTARGFEVTLDATAFYPEGGGQACDLGTLADARVLDVRERGEQVIHLCDKALAVGSVAEGRIDGERRFDLMQQHSGEHIVSGIVHKRFGYHNVGFHVGTGVMEIDFDGPISPEDLASIEEEANRAVWADLPIRCWYPSPEELPQVGYRTKRALPWPVRVVEIPGVDKCACCGVHTAFTGQIGLIKILSCIKFHQGVRLELVCGGRAYRHVSRIFEQNRLVSQAFSAKPLETGEAARRMNEALAAEKYRAACLEKRLYQTIADSYVNQERVLRLEPGLSGGALRELADRIAEKSGTALVLSGGEGRYSFCLICRREDASALGKAMLQALDGRGGGKKDAFQGTLNATLTQIRGFWEGSGC